MNHLQQSIHQAARRSARKADITARYGGLRYQCPCCRSRFRRFAPHGTPPRPNRACPNCRALVRHRLLWLYLSRELHVASRSYRVLHIAPERAMRRRPASAPNLTYVTADLNMPEAAVRALGRDTPILRVASRRVPALQPWLDWLQAQLDGHRAARGRYRAQARRPLATSLAGSRAP